MARLSALFTLLVALVATLSTSAFAPAPVFSKPAGMLNFDGENEWLHHAVFCDERLSVQHPVETAKWSMILLPMHSG